MKVLFLFATLFFTTVFTYPQDYIIRTNNERIDCRIIEINNDEVVISLLSKGYKVETSIDQKKILRIAVRQELFLIFSHLNSYMKSFIRQGFAL